MSKFYDQNNNRLVFIHEKATREFWAQHWSKYDIEKAIKSAADGRFVARATRRYLPEGSVILEGGCGMGQYVYCLSANGYQVYGVDFAQDAVRKAKEVVRDLNLCVGDVGALPFPDRVLDGYWSMGIIEHFYEGFDTVAMEMKRVLRPGGYLFLTFPCLSRLRRIKIVLNRYRLWAPSQTLEGRFYQFALSGQRVCDVFQDLGFELMLRKPTSGLKGLKDEAGSFHWVLRRVYNSSSLILKAFGYGLNLIFSPIAGHSEFMVLRKVAD